MWTILFQIYVSLYIVYYSIVQTDMNLMDIPWNKPLIGYID